MWSSPKTETAKGTLYKIDFSQLNWAENSKVEDRSDYVWTNTQDGRIMLSNSFCNEFQDQPLEKLALKTFNGIDGIHIDKQDYTTFQNREAYRLEGKGKVDGVLVGLKLLNTRRNNCYFDFLAISPMDTAQENPQDFDKFLSAVSFK